MSKKPTLLEQAKSMQRELGRKAREYTLEEEDLCMAWLNGEIKISQVQHAMNMKSTGQPYVFLAMCARQLFMKARKK